MPRFAANLTMMFNEVAFLDRFAAAADCGFRAVEFLFPYDHAPEEIARRLEAARLRQVLFNLPPGDWTAGDRGLAALPGRKAEFRRSVATALRYVRVIGVPNIHMMAGIADADDPEAVAAYRDALNYAADQAGEAGHPAVGLQFDIYHRQILHGDVIRGLEAMMPMIGHVQTASVPARHEPGSGELDDFRIFEALDGLSYTGWVGCEYRPAGATRDGLGWMDRAAAPKASNEVAAAMP